MTHLLLEGSGDHMYMQHEDSDSNSERYRYVYTGGGLRSTESLNRPDDGPSRIPVEASDIDSIPRGLTLNSYPQHFHREISAVDVPVCPLYRLPFVQRSTSNREYVEPVFEQNIWHLSRGRFSADSLAPSRPLTRQRGIRCPSTTSSTSTLSIVSGSDVEESDFEENTETVSGSSSHLPTSSMYDSAAESDTEDTRYLLASGCSTNTIIWGSTNGHASYSRGAGKSRMSARKQIYKKGSTTQASFNPAKSLPSMTRTHFGSHSSQCQSKNCSHVARKTQPKQGRSDIIHPTVDLSLKSSRRKYDCLITYASDVTTKRQLAAEYLITRGYNVMTDVSSCAIASYPALTEKDVLRKLEKIFHKCTFVLCFLSEEYVLRIIGKKTKADQMHIRFFAKLMEEEYKQNGKTNTRFLPIHIGSKYSKMNNMPKYLTSYPKDKCRQFQELVLEAFM